MADMHGRSHPLLEQIERQGTTQAATARGAGKSKQLLNDIVKGRTVASPETMLALARVLGLGDLEATILRWWPVLNEEPEP
jgi:transcriptional regulator with XRE-family HTH domain